MHLIKSSAKGEKQTMMMMIATAVDAISKRQKKNWENPLNKLVEIETLRAGRNSREKWCEDKTER